MTDSISPRTVRLGQALALKRGGTLDHVDIAYEAWGALSPAKDNAVLLFTGLSPSAHAASSAANPAPGWWDYTIGPGKPVDTNKFYVICVNSLGSCFGSTGPSSLNPRTGEPYRLTFPPLAVEDIARSAREALRALGITRLRAVVGASLGGMSSLAYAVQFPGEVRNLVSISGAAKAGPFAIAIRSLQREIIRADPAWRGGAYARDAEPKQGMRLARKLGLVSYRSAQEWDHRFARNTVSEIRADNDPFGLKFEIESYMEANASKFVGSFDANSYLYLSRAMDWFDLTEGGQTLSQVFAPLRLERSLIIGVETDVLFPIHQQREIADALKQAGHHVDFRALPSIQGHDAFLADKARFAPLVRDFFNSL